MLKILLASGNKKKLGELRNILEDFQLPVQVVSPAELGLSLDDLKDADGRPISLEEDGDTFAANALIKAEGLFRATGLPCLSDDSGLCVDALNGEPGVFSARYGGEGLTDEERNSLLLENLSSFDVEQRTARFKCVVCFVQPDQEPRYFQGEVEGSIAFAPSGSAGFGYDPVFIESSTGQCFAELSSAAKAELSHRGQALRSFARYLRSIVQPP